MHWDITALGEEAVLIRLGTEMDADTNRAVHALAGAIEANPPPWLRECVPAYATLALFIDTEHPICHDRLPINIVRDWLSSGNPASNASVTETAHPLIEIPVCHDSDFAPDLASLATHAGLSIEATIARHCAARYRVAMIGFAPGFPYLIGLDPALAMPRKATPRLRVPAGSLAIGGAQTGIYPQESPGGWQLIGRTPLRLFDPTQAQPSLLQPGQTVRFIAIDRQRFDALAAAAHQP